MPDATKPQESTVPTTPPAATTPSLRAYVRAGAVEYLRALAGFAVAGFLVGVVTGVVRDHQTLGTALASGLSAGLAGAALAAGVGAALWPALVEHRRARGDPAVAGPAATWPWWATLLKYVLVVLGIVVACIVVPCVLGLTAG